MENDIILYTSGYLAARLAVLGGFCYALYLVFRPRRVAASGAAGGYRPDALRVESMLDDRC